jgi:DNA primase
VLESLAAKRKWRAEELEKLGLLGVASDGKRRYDFFRGRIVIPIRNECGQAVGFGGRIFRVQDFGRKEIPKFLNPRETPLYQKSKILFNFDKARPSIKSSGEVIIVEGYMDAMSLASAGITNVVSICGTSLTREHSKILAKVARTAILCFDSDAAGQGAAERAFDIAFPLNLLKLRHLMVSDAKDPDEFVQTFGADAFRKMLPRATNLLERIIYSAKGEHASRGEWLRNVHSKVIPVIQRNPDATERDMAMVLVAKLLGLSSATLLE